MTSPMFIKPGMWRVLINCLGTPDVSLRGYRLAGVEKVNAYEDRGEIIALVWECDDEALAARQAEYLWQAQVPARVISTPAEEFDFLKHLLALTKGVYKP